MIVENLEKGGVKCCNHERDFTPGHGIFENMADKINASLHMLVVLSEDFSKSDFAQHELKEAIHQEIREDFSIIPLKIEPCDVPDILKNKTYIDCENDDITNVHHTIIGALIDNGLKTQLKKDASGRVISISLSKKSEFLSLPRFKLECDREKRVEIIRKTKLTGEDIEYIEKIANQSLYMKGLHIRIFLQRITHLIIFLLLLFCLAVIMLLACTMLGRSKEDSAYGGFVIMLVSILSPISALILCVGCFCWDVSTKPKHFMEKATKAVQRKLWSFNKNWQDKDAIVVFRSTLFTRLDTPATMNIIVIKFSRCKDLFIRKCAQREEYQKLRRHGESLNEYADRMIDWLLCSQAIYLLDQPRLPLQGGHRMINGAPCICLLLRESLLR
ncbi:uncharacterized protein LOC128218377 [Mya arenaria]|uniref:uncharacterized protein LOC128218377 n=1 Tax=Mya arenaria TaxID=6604 RepID=UPI0022E41E7B|nr:uncharacterized protein LOC128218377 [Mya arenaria]